MKRQVIAYVVIVLLCCAHCSTIAYATMEPALRRPLGMQASAEEAVDPAQSASSQDNLAQQDAQAARVARSLVWAILILLGAYMLLSIGVLVGMYRRYGTRRQFPLTLDAKLLRQIYPATAQLLTTGNTGAQGLAGTLMHMVEGGILTIAYIPDDIVFHVKDRTATTMPHQTMLLDWLFADNASLRISALDKEGDVDAATAFNERYHAWKAQVMQDALNENLVYPTRPRRMAMGTVLLLGLTLTFALLRYRIWPLALCAGALTLLFFILFLPLRKQPDQGAAQRAALQGLLSHYQALLGQTPEIVIVNSPLLMATGHMKQLAQLLNTQYAAVLSTHTQAATYQHDSDWPRRMVQLEQAVIEAQSHNAGIQAQGNTTQ